MELRHLRYFCAVAEHQSFTLAARRLHVSQSGVSGQVRDLEREIGVKLLQRTPREVSLTPEGAVFLREAREILKHSRTRGRSGVACFARSIRQVDHWSVWTCYCAISAALDPWLQEEPAGSQYLA